MSYFHVIILQTSCVISPVRYQCSDEQTFPSVGSVFLRGFEQDRDGKKDHEVRSHLWSWRPTRQLNWVQLNVQIKEGSPVLIGTPCYIRNTSHLPSTGTSLPSQREWWIKLFKRCTSTKCLCLSCYGVFLKKGNIWPIMDQENNL